MAGKRFGSRMRSLAARVAVYSVFGVMCIALFTGTRAVAQPSPWDSFQGRMGGGGLQPDFLRRDLRVFDETLRLDEGQAAIFEELFRDYEFVSNERIEIAREQMRAAVPDRRTIRNDRHETQRAIRAEMNQMMQTARQRSQAARSEEERQRIWKRYETGLARLRSELAQVGSGGADASETQRIQDEHLRIATEWQRDQSRYANDFLTSTYSLLSEEQQQYWPALERTLRREKTLSAGALAGESLDLIKTVRMLDLSGAQLKSVQAILDEYAIQLDDTLKRRNEYLSESREAFLTAAREGDIETVSEIGDRQVDRRVAVREVQERTVQAIAAVLSGATADEFMSRVNETAFDKVYRPTRVARLINSCRGLAGLDEETIAVVVAIENEYLDGLAVINERLRSLTRVHEPDRLRAQYERAATRGTNDRRGVRHGDALETEFQKRNRYDVQFVDRIRSVVPAEMFSHIPGSATIARKPGTTGSEGVGLANQKWAMQFDADGDGRLDASELEALKDVLRQNPPPE